MWINESARKHGVPDSEIRHAFDNFVVEIELDDDLPQRWLLLAQLDLGRCWNWWRWPSTTVRRW